MSSIAAYRETGKTCGRCLLGWARGVVWLFVLGVATPAWGGPPAGFPAPLAGWVENDIHTYADAAACQYGGGEQKYLPDRIKPPGTLIPITWNGKHVTWKVDDGTAGTGEFLFDGKSGVDSGDAEIVAAANARASKKFDDPFGTGLRCDHWPYVKPSCIPGQYVIEKMHGGIRWQILFRRVAAAAITAVPTATNWGPAHALYFDVVDAGGLDQATSASDKQHFNGATWFDALQAAGNCSVTLSQLCRVDSNCPVGETCDYTAKGDGGARDRANGFANGQAVPRPGGKHPYYRAEGLRASKWFDKVETMRLGRCDSCHGTPFNGTDWLRGSGLDGFRDDDAKPYWQVGNEVLGFVPEKTFFTYAQKGAVKYDCGGCHELWLQNAGTTPGEGAGVCSATVSQPCTTNADCPGIETCNNGGIAVAKLMTTLQTEVARYCSATKTQPCFLDTQCPGGETCVPILPSSFRTDAAKAPDAMKDAKKTLQMPRPMPGTVKTIQDWEDEFRTDYDAVSCCQGIPAAGVDCSGVKCEWAKDVPPVTGTAISKPDFYTPWMKKNGFVPAVPPANGAQKIRAPEVAKATFQLITCPAQVDGGPDPATVGPQDKCYQLKWQDTRHPFRAPTQWYWIKQDKSVLDLTAWPLDRAATLYCPRVAQREVVPYSKPPTQLGPDKQGDVWRFEYQSIGLLKRCQKTMVRFCGGWCEQDTDTNKDPNARRGLQAATDKGHVFELANGSIRDCGGTPSATPSPSASPTSTPSLSPTSTPSLSPTSTPSVSPTFTPSLSPTPSPPTPSPISTPSFSLTPSPTPSPTSTPSLSPTSTPSLSPTPSPPTPSPVSTPSFSLTPSPTPSPTSTPSLSPTPSPPDASPSVTIPSPTQSVAPTG